MDSSTGTPSLAHWLIVLFLGAIWGSAFMAMDLALDGFGPFWVAALRTGLAVPALLAVASISGQSFKTLLQNGVWRYVVPAGVLGMAWPFLLLSWGQQYVPSSFAGIAMGSLPIVLVPLAYAFLPDERLSALKIAGLLVGFLGLVLLVGSASSTATSNEYATLGRFACIAATFGYAIASVITRRCPPIPALAFSVGNSLRRAFSNCACGLLEGVGHQKCRFGFYEPCRLPCSGLLSPFRRCHSRRIFGDTNLFCTCVDTHRHSGLTGKLSSNGIR